MITKFLIKLRFGNKKVAKENFYGAKRNSKNLGC